MKKLGKLLAVAALMFTTLGSGISALADDAAIQPTSGDLTIHKHWSEDNSDIGDEGDGTEDNTVTNPPVAGVQFNVYKLSPQAAGTITEDDGTVVPTTDALAVPPSEKDGAVYTKLSGTQLRIDYNGKVYTYGMTIEGGSDKTDANGELKLTGLKGFYYVEEDVAASTPTVNTESVHIASPAKPFIISVPMTKTTEDGWNTDVHVYPKNQGQTPTKDVDGASDKSINIGDTIGYNIKVNIPSDIEDYRVYKINDKLDTALTYTKNSAVAYVYKDNGSGGFDKLAIPNTGNVNYTVTDADPTTGTGNENTLTVDFTKAGRDALQAYIAAAGGSYTHVGIEFKTIVNENVVEKPGYEVVNTGEIEFNNGVMEENEVDTTPTPEVKINVGNITIDKKDQKGTALLGSEFKVADTNANAVAGSFLKVKVTGGKIADILYPTDAEYADVDALNWVVRPGETNAAKLGVIGTTFYAASFDGLRTHSGEDTAKVGLKYYVVETLAPDGYNLLGDPVEVDFDGSETTNYVVTKEVVNSRGFKLPATGGMGLILITIAGIVLIGLAVMVFLPKKRRQA